MTRLLISTIFVLASAAGARADIITFFDFNDSDLVSDRGQSATITTTFGALGFAPGSTVGADPDGAGPEAPSAAGQALNLVGSANNGNYIQFGVSTLGLVPTQLSLATQRSSTGFNNNELLFSLDGGQSFTSVGFFTPPTTFALQTFNLAALAALQNQPEVVFRILLNGASSATGTNRIDNLLVTGDPQSVPVPEPVSVLLLGAGLLGVARTVRRRSRDGGHR